MNNSPLLTSLKYLLEKYKECVSKHTLRSIEEHHGWMHPGNTDIKTYLNDYERVYNKYASVIKNMDNTIEVNSIN